MQQLKLDLSGPIIKASCADPYLLVMTSEGQIVLLTFAQSGSKGRLNVMKANLKSRSQLVNICAYEDKSGLFTTEKVSVYSLPFSTGKRLSDIF